MSDAGFRTQSIHRIDGRSPVRVCVQRERNFFGEEAHSDPHHGFLL